MPRPSLILIGALLLAIVALCFVRPQVMVAPGPVIAAHAAIAQDCFACHAPLRGASTERCTTCHMVTKIGLFTTTGRALPHGKAIFHQALIAPDCMGCHTDHAGPKLAGHTHPGFSHALLKPEIRGQCATCHAKPGGTLHAQLGTLTCNQCHGTNAWKPARFAHDRLFRLDGDHNVACATCHIDNNYARYTCYGCHEHQPAQILALHRNEGIANINDCARCHRSGEGEGGEGGEGRRKEHGGDDD
jgi:hypothetical protein